MTDTGLEAVAETVSGNARGVLLWRDLPKVWFGDDAADDKQCAAWLEAWTAAAVTVERGRRSPLDLASFPVSILETMCPDSLKTALLEGDQQPADPLPVRLARSPGLSRAHCPRHCLTTRRCSTGCGACRFLARTPDDPCELRVDERGVKALDGVLIDLHAARRSAGGSSRPHGWARARLHRPLGGYAGASGIHGRPPQSARRDRS